MITEILEVEFAEDDAAVALTPEERAKWIGRITNERDADNCWLWAGSTDGKGYGFVRFRSRQYRVHRLSYLIYKGNIPAGMCVCHDCPTGDNPSCFNPAHLWLGTNTQNVHDKEKKGRGGQPRGSRHGRHTQPEKTARGENNGTALLTEEDVRSIRTRYAAGGLRMGDLGAEYGVHKSTIYLIVHRKNWAHVI